MKDNLIKTIINIKMTIIIIIIVIIIIKFSIMDGLEKPVAELAAEHVAMVLN